MKYQPAEETITSMIEFFNEDINKELIDSNNFQWLLNKISMTIVNKSSITILTHVAGLCFYPIFILLVIN